jgi:putative aldouronate transport system permease protein
MSLRTPISPGMPAKKTFWQSLALGRTWPLYAMLLPGLIALFLFNYKPLYGLVIAFQEYQPVSGFADSPWVGWANFEDLFTRSEFPLLLRNTVVIAVGKIFLTQLAALSFALLLNEVRNQLFKRGVQTVVYMPHFLSWIILGGVFIDLLSEGGAINSMIKALGLAPITFLAEPSLFPGLLITTHAWKEFGWSAIIFLAALTNVDPQLHEAAAIDGAGRWQRIWNISLPAIAPIIILVAALSLGNVLDAGFEQILVLYNPLLRESGDVIATYVYRAGLERAQFSLATAVGLFQSVISLVLIITSRWMAARFAKYQIF